MNQIGPKQQLLTWLKMINGSDWGKRIRETVMLHSLISIEDTKINSIPDGEGKSMRAEAAIYRQIYGESARSKSDESRT